VQLNAEILQIYSTSFCYTQVVEISFHLTRDTHYCIVYRVGWFVSVVIVVVRCVQGWTERQVCQDSVDQAARWVLPETRGRRV